MKDFFSKCDQVRSFLWIWSHLLRKSLMKNFIFCTVKQLHVAFFFIKFQYHLILELHKKFEKRTQNAKNASISISHTFQHSLLRSSLSKQNKKHWARNYTGNFHNFYQRQHDLCQDLPKMLSKRSSMAENTYN